MNDSSHEDYFSVQYCFEIEEEKILSTLNLFAQNQVDLMDINRVLELYNIRLYFDKHYKINDCEDDKYSKYREAFLDVIKAVTNFLIRLIRIIWSKYMKNVMWYFGMIFGIFFTNLRFMRE